MVFNDKLVEIIQKHRKPSIVTMHDSFIFRVCNLFDGLIIFEDSCLIKYRQHTNNVIGVNKTKKESITRFFDYVFKKRKVCIDHQASELLDIYGCDISLENKKILLEVSNYKKNLICKIKFSFSKKIKFNSLSSSIKNRVTMLLGNR